MAEYTFWAIRESDVTWPGTQDEIGSGPYAYWQVGTLSASLSFAIDDISKFRQVTIRDDDPRLNQWLDSASGQDAQTPVDFPTGGGNSFVATTTTKAVNELDGGRIIRFDDQGGTDGWITFTGIEPGAIKEGEIYTLSRISEDWSGTNPYADSPEYDTLYVTCFTSNTLIETNHGNKPVEDLRPGDMIATMDNGYQPIRWIGSTARDAVDLAHHPKLKPVRIPAGALGGGLPKRDLTVSRQHRVLIDLPLNLHPAATGARLLFTPIGAG